MEIEKSLYEYACRILARRRYTSKELVKKFESRLDPKFKKFKSSSLTTEFIENPEDLNHQKSAIENVLARLIKLKFINDAEYANLYVQTELNRKPQSLKMLEYALIKKGVSEDLISNALHLENFDENELARKAVQKKMRSLHCDQNQKLREKLHRFLASRGFSSDTILSIVGEFCSKK